jgi:hypothetical protein
MSVAELKRAVEVLSEEDRLELSDHLRRLAKRNDPSWRAEITRRLDRCRAGGGHSGEELRQTHERLTSQGR